MPFQDYGYKPSGITRPRARPTPKETSSSYYSGNEFGSGNIFTETSPGASTVNFGNNNRNDNDRGSSRAPSLVQAPTPTVTAPAAPTPAQIEADRQDRIARVFEAAGATLPQDTGRGGRAGRGIDLYSRDIFTTPYVATPDNTQEIEDYLQRTAVDDALREALGVPEVYQGMPTQEDPETNIDMSILQKAMMPEPITVEELPDGTTPEMFEGMDGSYMFEEDSNKIRPGEMVTMPEAWQIASDGRAELIMKGVEKLFGLFPPKSAAEKKAKSELQYFLDAGQRLSDSSLAYPSWFKYIPDKIQLADYISDKMNRNLESTIRETAEIDAAKRDAAGITRSLTPEEVAERNKATGAMNFTGGDVDMSNLQFVDIGDETDTAGLMTRPRARPEGLDAKPIKVTTDKTASNVKTLQQALTDKGYKPNGVDGSMGGGTARALRKFQSANNLPITGELTQEVADLLTKGEAVDYPDKPVPVADVEDIFTAFNLSVFENEVGKIESGNKYDIKGGAGNHYDGRYQMGAAAKKDAGRALGITLGHDAASREAFRKDSDLQDRAFKAYTEKNHRHLTINSEKYRNMTDQEKLGVLGYAHNQGATAAEEYLFTGQVGTDAFGTKGTKYTNAIAKAFGN